MSLKSVLVDAGILFATLTIGISIGVGIGTVRSDRTNATKIANANAATLVANGNTARVQGTLNTISQKLNAQADQLKQAQAAAATALAEGAITKTQLSTATTERIAAERKAAHESPDCADLARLPICPAVSDRLFRYGLEANGAVPASSSSR